jgi:hypothetical protein
MLFAVSSLNQKSKRQKSSKQTPFKGVYKI